MKTHAFCRRASFRLRLAFALLLSVLWHSSLVHATPDNPMELGDAALKKGEYRKALIAWKEAFEEIIADFL